MKHSSRPQDFDLQKAEKGQGKQYLRTKRSLQHPDHINNSDGSTSTLHSPAGL